MLSLSSLPATRQARTVSRRIWRAAALLLLLAALSLALLAWRAGAPDGTEIGPATRFDYVAVFPAGASAADVEAWRGQVFKVHEDGCLHGHACVARSLRGAGLGRASQFALGFDLMGDAPPAERAALLSAAAQAHPLARLVPGSSLRQAVE
jgi:hypothetical protein